MKRGRRQLDDEAALRRMAALIVREGMSREAAARQALAETGIPAATAEAAFHRIKRKYRAQAHRLEASHHAAARVAAVEAKVAAAIAQFEAHPGREGWRQAMAQYEEMMAPVRRAEAGMREFTNPVTQALLWVRRKFDGGSGT
ncbi:MAG: hypothetical protein KIT07_01450 [Anaerolineales bacterium]|nr:hypothetical protein [Alphaproteobacteria bacterium]MCW5886773.1 hypothetical protein [Anaerolineales bacterium]